MEEFFLKAAWCDWDCSFDQGLIRRRMSFVL